MRIPLISALVIILTAASPLPGDPVGTWVWHGKWQRAPKEIGDVSNAYGVVLSFCSDGRFRMASGVLYRNDKSAVLGSDDGLALYNGRWTQDAGHVKVTYALVDAELRGPDYDQLVNVERTTMARFGAGQLHLIVYRWADGQPLDLQFSRAASSKPVVLDRFVECNDN